MAAFLFTAVSACREVPVLSYVSQLPHSNSLADTKMAYLMKYRGLGLIDAYLMTRARRLNGEYDGQIAILEELS